MCVFFYACCAQYRGEHQLQCMWRDCELKDRVWQNTHTLQQHILKMHCNVSSPSLASQTTKYIERIEVYIHRINNY